MPINFLSFVIVMVSVAFAAYQFGKRSSFQTKQIPQRDKSVSISSILSSKDSSLKREVIILRNHELGDALHYFNKYVGTIPALRRLLDLYQVERNFPDLSYFRLGPNMFDKIILDWIIIYDAETDQLVGHGITTRFAWDQNNAMLPCGWQGVVRTSYVHSHIEHRKQDTLVGLFIFIEDQFRQQGWANNVIEEMRTLAQQEALSALIIPLRPPLRYKKEYAAMPMDEFAQLKRDDGLPLDHWVRLHTRLGAKILSASEKSHRHVLNLQDFHDHFSSAPLPHSGDVLIERKGEWYNVYVDLERDFVLINQGCVWARHEF